MRSAFTLIELLVVIAIIAILAVVVVLTLNPAQLLAQSRDGTRVSDMATLSSAINLYNTDQGGASGFSLGSSSVIYVSLPDPNATTTAGTNCSLLGLPTLPATYSYHCAASSTYRNSNGLGWIPINFQSVSSGNPLGSFPVDPLNASSSYLYYTYVTNGTQYQLSSHMESAKYISEEAASGGSDPALYMSGSNTSLAPFVGDMVGWWQLNEGSSGTAIDSSGEGNIGSWSGTPTGISSYYSPGYNQAWAGAFDGGTDTILASSSAIKFTGDFTVLLWVKTTASSSNQEILSTMNYGNNTGYVFLVGSNHEAYFDMNFNQYYIHAGAVDNGQWHQIVFTRSGGNGIFYQDGVNTYAYTSVVTSSFSSINPTIAIGSDHGSTYFAGSIEDVRFYSRALSATEVQAIYNTGK